MKMEQVTIERSTDHRMMPACPTTSRSRSLTYDEKKASEAAFQGLPFNPDWSLAAQKVYEGITAAMNKVSVGGRPASARLFA
jgi:hypothetical protein